MGVEDYFMRQVNQLGKVLGKIIMELLKLKTIGSPDQSIGYINQQLTTALKIDLDTIIEIPIDHFIETFEKDYGADYSNFEDLAELLYHVAYLFDGQNDKEKSKAIFQRALLLYNYLLQSGKTFSMEYSIRIEEITTYINADTNT